MTSRNHDVDPLIELLGDRTRLNLRESTSPQPAEAPAPPRADAAQPAPPPRVHRGAGEGTRKKPSPAHRAARRGNSTSVRARPGRCYLSCPSCFKMWQEVREPDRVFQMADEALWQMK